MWTRGSTGLDAIMATESTQGIKKPTWYSGKSTDCDFLGRTLVLAVCPSRYVTVWGLIFLTNYEGVGLGEKSLSWFQGPEFNSGWKRQAGSPEEMVSERGFGDW